LIVGLGIDVCDVSRFAAAVQRRPGIVQRLFTPAEAERPVASQAARFAAKEALAKALGAPSGMSWLDAEVLTDDTGRPSFRIVGTVAARASELGVATIHVSLSHDAGIASAVVVCEA
jgi:holo-[acyl-carrier protein] synthase